MMERAGGREVEEKGMKDVKEKMDDKRSLEEILSSVIDQRRNMMDSDSD